MTDRLQNALRSFDAAGFNHASIIRRSWFYEALDLPLPTATMTYADGKELELAFVAQMAKFKELLLVERKVALMTVSGAGFRIVTPAQQARWASKILNEELSSAFSRAALRAFHVQVDELSVADQMERSRILNRMASMRDGVDTARARDNRESRASTKPAGTMVPSVLS